jgi:predicted DNA binding CopG/RHH family protein
MPKQHKPETKKLKTIPAFKTEENERQFWEDPENDATEYFDVSKMVIANFSHLKPSTTSISLRLSDSLLEGIRQQANKLDVPYQSLMKIWLMEKLRESTSS